MTEETTIVHAIGDEWEGQTITGVAFELPGLAGGLRDAVKVNGGEPIARGQKRFLLLEVVGSKTRFDPSKDDEHECVRVDILGLAGASFVGGQTFERAMAKHHKEVDRLRLAEQRAKEEAKGVQRVPGTEPWEDEDDDAGSDGDPADADADAD